MKRVLVTGATGFVGRSAAAALSARGFDVHGTTRGLQAVGRTADVTLRVVDLLDANAASGLVGEHRPTHLLISAWTTTHGEFWSDPRNDSWEAATVALVRSFFSAGGQRAVLVGTCAEYDWSDPVLERGPIREDMAQGTPHTVYGRAKRRVEKAIEKIAGAAGGSYAVGRLFYPIGWGEDRRRLVPSIVDDLAAGRIVKLISGQHVRDVIDVRDAGAALASLLDSKIVGAVNVGTGNGIRLAELARRLGEMVGRPDLIGLGTLPPRVGEPPVLVADVSRLAREVGFHPRYSLDDTLSTSLSYWRTAGSAHTQASC